MLFSIPDNGWKTGLRLYEIIYFRFLSCRFDNQILSQFQPFDKNFFSRFRNMYFFLFEQHSRKEKHLHESKASFYKSDFVIVFLKGVLFSQLISLYHVLGYL